ncbi:unnamed protein product [Schistosoma guineensis]|nr:unnamed protein product [Schistosoma guineensis]
MKSPAVIPNKQSSQLPVEAEVHRGTKACEVLKVTVGTENRNDLINSINYVPAWSSDLKRTQSMAGGMLLTYAYLHALMCRRIPTACSQL